MKGKTATRKNPSTGSLATVIGPVGGPYNIYIYIYIYIHSPKGLLGTPVQFLINAII